MKNRWFCLLLYAVALFGYETALHGQNSGTYNVPAEKDTYVSESNPDANFAFSTDLVAGRHWEFGYLYRIYLKFDHSPIPADAEVLSAEMHIYMGAATSDSYQLEVRKVTSEWGENYLSWNNQPGMAHLVSIGTTTLDSEPGWKTFDIREAVSEWIAGESSNEGIALMAGNETGDLGECWFHSRETGGCQPYIQVVYLTDSVVPVSPDAPVCNTTGDDTPPELEITFSEDPLRLGNQVRVTASAYDPEGIQMVQLYRGNTHLNTSSDNYSRTYLSTNRTVTPGEAGPMMFFAVAYNDRMQCTRVSKRLLVQVDGEAPTVTLHHLPQHPAMGEGVTFHASAQDLSGIANLSIEVNGIRHFLEITPGERSVSGELRIGDADIFYDPATTRLVTYAATSYDREGNHTTYGPHTVVFGEGSGTDSDDDGLDDDIEELMGTDPESEDTDGDGLFDSWEVFGVDRDNDGDIDLDLPGYGATPHQKDLFIEMDWMEDDSHSHKPHPWTVQTAINLFMCYGIRLHVDAGSMGGGNAVPHTENMGEDLDKLNLLLSTKLDNCDPARFGIFRYALYGHGWGQYFGTGNMTVRSDPPNAENNYDEPYFQARQLIHEIGHSLGLGHGGQSVSAMDEAYALDRHCYLERNDLPSWISTNYKPNYLSIMNYLYEGRNGLKALTSGGEDIMIIGFSQNPYSINDLDENHLNESAGIDYPLDWNMYTWRREGDTLHKLNDWFEGTYYMLDVKEWVADGNGFYKPKTSDWILADGRPIDWDKDGNDSETNVSADVNMNGEISLLTSENDVDDFVLQIRSSHRDRFLANENSREDCIVTTEICDGLDNDSDGMIDEGFPDLDRDGVADFIDNALNAYNPRQVDINQNFIGDYVEVPLAKATHLEGTFDRQKINAHLSWETPYPAPALLGFNVYRKDRSGTFKRVGISFPTTLYDNYMDPGPFALEIEDTVTYYVRPVNLYMMEGRRSDYLTLYPAIQTTATDHPGLSGNSVTCFPNPFTEFTRISFSLAERGRVTVTIYNLLGEKVCTLIDTWQPAGPHTVEWNGAGNSGGRLPVGCYICRIQSKKVIHTFRILLNN